MVEINCLVCGKAIEIPEFIDTNNYDGQINCPGCKSLLQIKLVGAKVRKYMVAERKSGSATAAESRPSQRTSGEAVDVESVAKYNPLRDYLTTYRAAQLNMTFEYIEHIIGSKLETAAYTFKSWWENDRRNPQAIAWLDSGWEVDDVDLQRRGVVLRRVKQS
jgi:uncharacterized Zn finger protein (UPF0148 family)